ncbi:hypothetical protein AB0C28_41600 [Nonomuraea sp. NPDC048892]|uniref:hypothetical protein n=1 Tax=Nonomuraea sp. NPDC048892 TaxID=3154624 RepID=UPI0033DC4BA6
MAHAARRAHPRTGASGQLADQHWEFGRLYGALLDVVVALGNAYPGGIDRLKPRH